MIDLSPSEVETMRNAITACLAARRHALASLLDHPERSADAMREAADVVGNYGYVGHARDTIAVQAYNDACQDVDTAVEVVDKIEALDEWLTRDGFLPLDWQQLGNLVAECRLKLGEHDAREERLHELLAEAESDPCADVAADEYRHYDYLESCEEALAVARRLLDALGCTANRE